MRNKSYLYRLHKPAQRFSHLQPSKQSETIQPSPTKIFDVYFINDSHSPPIRKTPFSTKPSTPHPSKITRRTPSPSLTLTPSVHPQIHMSLAPLMPRKSKNNSNCQIKFKPDLPTQTIHSRRNSRRKPNASRNKILHTSHDHPGRDQAKAILKSKIIEGTAIISFVHYQTLETSPLADHLRTLESVPSRHFVSSMEKTEGNKGIGERPRGKTSSSRAQTGSRPKVKPYRPWSPPSHQIQRANQHDLEFFLNSHC